MKTNEKKFAIAEMEELLNSQMTEVVGGDNESAEESGPESPSCICGLMFALSKKG